MKPLLVLVIFGLAAAQAHRGETAPSETCNDNDGCPEHKACYKGKCFNPCNGACGNHAQCEVRSHMAYCSCDPGYTGCPLYGCVPQRDPIPSECETSEECDDKRACINEGCVDPCSVMNCGPGHTCTVSKHTAACTPAVILSSVTPERLTVPPTPTPDCTLECPGDDQCPPDKACIDHHCVDPCSGRCGANSTCRVVNHVPSCACLPGYKGNPFESCTYQPGVDCLKSLNPVAGGKKKFRIDRTKKVDWLEALQRCTKNGHRLATVMDQQELNDIKQAIRNTDIRGGNFWIAGTDHLHNKEWYWFTTNQMERIGAFTDWMKNQPDSDGEDCLEFWEANQQIGYKWNDRPCHEKHHYICEYFE